MKSLADMLAKEDPVIGTWSQIGSPDVVEILGRSGFDFTIIDLEHTTFNLETAVNLMRACHTVEMIPVVRVSKNDRVEISKAMDAGAAAVVVPGIETVADAEAAIAATQYEPSGNRGSCPFIRSGGHFVDDWHAYTRGVEKDTGTILLIESREGVSNIEAIAALPGLRSIIAGPFDLSVSLGFNGDWRHPEVQSSLDHMVDTAAAAGVPVIMPVFSADISETQKLMKRWLDRGTRHFTLGGDKVLLLNYCTRYINALTSTAG